MTHSVTDIAERFAVSERTVVQWVRAGELKAVNVSKSPRSKRPRFRIRDVDLEAFEASRMPVPPVLKPARRKRDTEVIEFYK